MERRSDVLTFEKTLTSGTAWSELAKWHTTPPRKLLVMKVEIESLGEVQIQLTDATKEVARDLNMNVRKVKFFPVAYPTPIEIGTDHDFVVNGMQTYGYDVDVKGRIEVVWV